MQILLIVSLCIVAILGVPQGMITIDDNLNDEWETYKQNFGKHYESLSEIARRIIWEQNLRYIQQHNLEYDLGKHTYYLGLNAYADMTNEEFKTKYLGLKPTNRNIASSHFLATEYLGALPTSVDWRTKGYVTPVKNQGNCGSCWAFSTTGSLEGQHFRKTGNLISFSEQQLVDCSWDYKNNGCDGGTMDQSFQYIKQFGIESEASYPYTVTNGTCKYDKSNVVGTVTGYVDVDHGNETALATAVATVGPISVGIDANHVTFRFYNGGIYNEPECSSTNVDHGVLAVGYGSQNGQNFWLVKNSWGPYWGYSGYILMSKDINNQCGIASNASYPLV